MNEIYKFGFNFLEVNTILIALEAKKIFYEECYDNFEAFPATGSDYRRVCDLMDKLHKIYE